MLKTYLHVLMAQYCMYHSDCFVQYLQIQYICFGTDLRPAHFICCHSRQPPQATDCKSREVLSQVIHSHSNCSFFCNIKLLINCQLSSVKYFLFLFQLTFSSRSLQLMWFVGRVSLSSFVLESITTFTTSSCPVIHKSMAEKEIKSIQTFILVLR